MDTSRLHVGLIVKSYAELCRLVGEKPAGGNSRPAQIKRFGRAFAWEKRKGNSLVITEIYSEEQPKPLRIDEKYGYDILTCLQYDYAEKEKERRLGNLDDRFIHVYSFFQLLSLCGFTSHQWKTSAYQVREALKEYRKAGTPYKDRAQLEKFFGSLDYHIKTYCGNALHRSLIRLAENKFLTRYEKRRWVKDRHETRPATAEEKLIYEEIEETVKKKMNIRRITWRNSSAYYAMCNEMLKTRTGLDKTWMLSNIVVRTPFDPVSSEAYLETRKRINQSSVSQLRHAAESDIRKGVKGVAEALEKSEDSLILEIIDLFRITPEEIYTSPYGDIADELETKNELVSWFVELDGDKGYRLKAREQDMLRKD